MLRMSVRSMLQSTKAFSTKILAKDKVLKNVKDVKKLNTPSEVFIPPRSASNGVSYKYLYNKAVKAYNEKNPENKKEFITWGMD